MAATKHKFFELIKPNHDFNFVGRMRMLLTISIILIVVSLAMLPINHFWRGHTLNYGIEFRGGTEIQVAFSKDQDPAAIRDAMHAGGFKDAEVVKIKDAAFQNSYLLRFGAVSTVSEKKSEELQEALKQKFGADGVRKFEFSEGGDKVYVRFTKPV